MHDNRPLTVEVLLSYAPLFEGLGPEALARLARGTRDIPLARNEVLFEKGTPCRGFHLVVHGQVKLSFVSAQGVEKVVGILDQDQTYGETLMLEEQPYPVSARALADSLLLHVPREVILAEFDTSPRLRLRLLARMSARLHELMADGQSYARESGTQRFIGYLLGLLREASAPQGRAMVALPTSKSTIASRLNLTKEHFSRILQALARQGLIEVAGRRVLVPDVARLAGYREEGRPSFQAERNGGCGQCGAPARRACGRTPEARKGCRE